MPGFDTGSVMFALNVDFTGNSLTEGTAQVTGDGQLLIGSAVVPNIRVGSLGSSDGSITWTVGNGTITGQVTGGATVGRTITGNTGGPVSPTAGNWNILGAGETSNNGTPGTSTLAILAPRNSRWIVDPTPNRGTHTTIAGAVAAAASGDVIVVRPGTYTENVTIPVGLTLAAYSYSPVTINGTLTMTTAGTYFISGITLQTNGANYISITGSAAVTLFVFNCNLLETNATGLNLNNSNANVSFENCFGQVTAGQTRFSVTAGNLNYYNCDFDEANATTVASTIAANNLTIRNTRIGCPITTSGTAGIGLINSSIAIGASNATCLTVGGSGANQTINNTYVSGTATAISVSGSLTSVNENVSSSNANAIAGAGTITYQDMTFYGASHTIGTTTQVGGQYIAQNTSTAIAVGFLGERISSVIPLGSAVASATTVSTNMTSISLTPGVWDVTMIMALDGVTTGTQWQASISSVSATLSGNTGDSQAGTNNVNVTAVDPVLVVPAFRVSHATTTIYYAVGKIIYTVGAGTLYGRLSAVRVG